MVKNAVVNGVTLTIENVYNRLKKTDDKLKKKNILINGKKDLNKGIKSTQNELKNLCNISNKCANKQFIKACDDAYSKIIAGQDAENAIESSIKKLVQNGIEVIGYTKNNTSMDAAVRRAVTSGVNQTSLKIKIANCEKFGINDECPPRFHLGTAEKAIFLFYGNTPLTHFHIQLYLNLF